MEYSTNPKPALPEFVRKEFSSNGFMYRCRHLDFDQQQGDDLIRTILGINVPSLTDKERRNVAVGIFDLPFLLAAWREKCIQNGADAKEYSRVMRELHQAVYDKMNELLVSAEST